MSTVAGSGNVGRTDGLVSIATFYSPRSIVAMPNGVTVSDSSNHLVRVIVGMYANT